jgi:hypothetical protein
MKDCAMFDSLTNEQQQRENMLQITLAGGIDIWVGYEGEKFAGFVFSSISTNELTSVRNFVILGVWTEEGFTDEMFKVCLYTLSLYARSRGCQRLITFTAIPHLAQRLKGLGGKMENVQITFDL